MSKTLALLISLQTCLLARADTQPLMVSPYKDVTIGIDAARPLIARTAWERAGPTPPALVWAFATGECGSERWGDFDTGAFAALNVAAFNRDGRDYIVSTGGEAGAFTCASDAGMEQFVGRYVSPRLRGLDFDIEGKQTDEQIDSLVRRAQAAQRARPQLRISFTLATHAASDGTRRSLNGTGERVLRAIVASGFDSAVINLMVMNYGAADRKWCVVDSGRCDMGASALHAARNVHARYGIAYHRMALTAMLGENDVQGNAFALADVQRLAQGARRLGLAGLHYWSLDRDQTCPTDAARVSPRCHGLPGLAQGEFGAAFERALRVRVR